EKQQRQEELEEEEAAIRIQRGWRKYKKRIKRNEALKSKRDKFDKLATLLKSNDELIAKLEAVRASKAYAIMKYETIARMNAKDVNAYLRREYVKPTPAKGSEYETILERQRNAKANNAALVIQRFFRFCAQKKREQKTLRAWKRITPQRRVELISAIAERMSTGEVPRKNDLDAIKTKLAERKEAMTETVAAYERREGIIKRLERDLQLLGGISTLDDLLSIDPRRLRTSTVLRRHAENETKHELQQQEVEAFLVEGDTALQL
uniref:HSA domain-containing protein n=1 Tax=Ascaris lumbricoides TaxID=6252 RepID=A0A0M3HUF0_ASCLU